MIFDVLSIFPELFESPLACSILGKARERGLIQVRLHDIRQYATDKHQMTDDRPYGGGEGMVMKPEPMVRAIEDAARNGAPARVVLLSPHGRLFDQALAEQWSRRPRLILVCGRYEGVDARVAEHFVDDEISIGDYVLTGGELAALVLIDAIARLIPGVLGNESSPLSESFGEPILEHPQYTRPREYRNLCVPDILLSGNHQRIRRWRRLQALRRTRERRPDLFGRLRLSAEDQYLLEQGDGGL